MWSVGVIVTEMATSRPLFPADSEIDLLFTIFRFLGTPNDEVWPGLSILKKNREFPFWASPENNFKRYINRDIVLVDLLKKILVYYPPQRLEATQALNHPYFNQDYSLS
eukprot:TRINITY_DN4092_c0_g1_i3.p2 TRINITY_DN4092_c0_g1~~TRINITY_DN4092_c0_g1_i3.p2  ORF type:complete len:109 (-),score=14.93 TRINITY_DN4092_c0_g1_i3:44-370(-)